MAIEGAAEVVEPIDVPVELEHPRDLLDDVLALLPGRLAPLVEQEESAPILLANSDRSRTAVSGTNHAMETGFLPVPAKRRALEPAMGENGGKQAETARYR
ncbi:MAG TPA: hypothetical protein EYN79_07340 [Planctomycetes bacterium]|nr:hypothetical protein [Planctomycetota bacterium]